MAIEGREGSVVQYLLVAGDEAIPTRFNPVVDPYCYVRVLPADNDIAALDPTWDNVYEKVLINWYAMAPCMDNWLKLDDESQVAAYAHLLRRLTSPNAFESFRFMPVTRDLTPGQRTLLYGWLDAVEGEASPPAVAHTPSPTEMGRKLRRA